MHTIRTALLALLAAGCAQVTQHREHFVHDELATPPPAYHLQGILGVTDFRDVDVDIDGASEADAPTLPLLGGALQYPMLGDRDGSGMRARVGLETGMTFGYDGNTDIFFVDNGVAVVRSEDRLFVADLFGAVMVLLAGIVGVAVAVYSLVSIDRQREQFGYHPLYHFLLMGVCGAFLTGDLFNLYVWFEVMLMASFVLMALGGERA